MQDAHDIIIAPVISEKSTAGIADKKYTFRVARAAGKQEIGRAVEQLFEVAVVKVNTISVRGRLRRQGRAQGYTARWKKAIVTLSPDSKAIEFFEGML